jgi:hypothetical protein
MDDATCNLGAGGDLINTDPLLGPLADNGGPTLTHLLQDDSSAIDAAPSCPTDTDQRRVARPQGPPCDIGSVEVIGGPTYLLCVAWNTGAVTSPLYGQGCEPGTIAIEPYNQSVCIDLRTDQLLYFFGQPCVWPGISHTTPDDGDLLTCVRVQTGVNHWVLDHGQCGTYERPNTIPAGRGYWSELWRKLERAEHVGHGGGIAKGV